MVAFHLYVFFYPLIGPSICEDKKKLSAIEKNIIAFVKHFIKLELRLKSCQLHLYQIIKYDIRVVSSFD